MWVAGSNRNVVPSRSSRRDGRVAGLLILLAGGVAAQGEDIPRQANGRPDLSGSYNVATLTPLERPTEFGNNLFLTPEQAEAMSQAEMTRRSQDEQAIDGNRGAPPEGGDGTPGAYGNVGGYNYTWLDRGTGAFEIDGKFRTSIITTPANGRRPELTQLGQRAAEARAFRGRPNKGEAWWLAYPGPGPYDDPELRPLAERCLLGFSSTAGPPTLPAGYNNVKRIVQSESQVMILIEMVHDARIIRLNAEHDPPEIRKWLGDSVGHWEGDTLVVDTTNFTDQPALSGATRNLHVVERFRRLDDERLHYSFTVEDPTVWTEPWGGEYIWPQTGERLYEYACHEGNYALGGILRGARILESEWQGERHSDD